MMKATQWKMYKKTMPLVYQGEFMQLVQPDTTKKVPNSLFVDLMVSGKQV